MAHHESSPSPASWVEQVEQALQLIPLDTAYASWLGLRLNPVANASQGPRITLPGSLVPAYVIPTDEELMIARHTRKLISV